MADDETKTMGLVLPGGTVAYIGNIPGRKSPCFILQVVGSVPYALPIQNRYWAEGWKIVMDAAEKLGRR